MSEVTPIPSSANRFGWAAFLGISWTWCIGMYLPILLVREFGLAGWIVFAIPNVVGAAAMGWALRSIDSSRRMVAEHRSACTFFSLVTILFQLYFAKWMIGSLLGWPGLLIFLAAIVAFYTIGRIRPTNDLRASIGVWAASIVILGLFFFRQPSDLPPMFGMRSSVDLLGLSLVCLFGFALCPYLDLTFHRARQALSPADSKLAFGAGFGVIFFLMIIGSLMYARTLDSGLDRLAGSFLASHFLIQLAFTISLHHQEIRANGTKQVQLLELVIGIFVMLWLCTPFFHPPFSYNGISGPELIYRLFMAFYGLVFPAYVWLFIVPWRNHPERVSVGALKSIFVGAIGLAGPMFWLGFIEKRYAWLIGGLLIVFLAKLAPLPSKASQP